MLKRILLAIIVIVLLTACATPTASPTLTSIPTRTPTILPTGTAPPTSTSTPEPTATLTQTDTVEPTATKEPTPTSTPELAPAPPLEDVLVNLTPEQKAEVLLAIENQHPIQKENGTWHELVVCGGVVTHEPPVKLPGTDIEMSHSLLCNNGKGLLHLSFYAWDKNNMTEKGTGFLPEEDSSPERIDRFIKRYSSKVLPKGLQRFLNDVGWSGPGHIFNLAFVSPAEVDNFTYLTERGYFNEAIDDMYESGALEKFAETGDSTHLLSDTYQTEDGYPILLPVNVSFTHTYGSWQFENSQQE